MLSAAQMPVPCIARPRAPASCSDPNAGAAVLPLMHTFAHTHVIHLGPAAAQQQLPKALSTRRFTSSEASDALCT